MELSSIDVPFCRGECFVYSKEWWRNCHSSWSYFWKQQGTGWALHLELSAPEGAIAHGFCARRPALEAPAWVSRATQNKLLDTMASSLLCRFWGINPCLQSSLESGHKLQCYQSLSACAASYKDWLDLDSRSDPQIVVGVKGKSVNAKGTHLWGFWGHKNINSWILSMHSGSL